MTRSRNTFFTAIRQVFALVSFIVCIVFSMTATAAAQGGETADDAVAIFNQAQDLHEKGDLKAAIELYEKAIKILPEFPEAEYQRGVALLALKRPDDAEKAFRRAVELRPDWTLALASLGALLVDRSNYAEAEKLLTRAMELDAQNTPALAALVDLRLKTMASQDMLKDLLAKIAALTSKANPTAALWIARASLERSLAMNDAAKSSLAHALVIDPRNKTALFMTAQIALAEGDIVHASEAADTLDPLGANASSLKLLRANILVREGKLDEALKMLDSIEGTNAAADELRASIKAATATNPAEIEKQLAADPKNVSLIGRLCSLYRVSDPLKALDYCKRANDIDPRNIDYAIGYGAALVQAKQYDAAAGLLKWITAFAPDNWTAHANLATALFEMQRYMDAKTEYQWLSSAKPSAAAPYYFLGMVHDRLGEYMDAMANYQQYLRLADPVKNKLDIDKVTLRLPSLQKQIKEGKGKKSE